MELQAFYGISPHVNYVQAQSLPARSQRYIDPDHVLTYVQSGAVEMELLGREYTISPGEMILVPPLAAHRVGWAAAPATLYVLTFDLYYSERSLMPREGRPISSDGVNLREWDMLDTVDVVRLDAAEQEWFERKFREMAAKFRETQPERFLSLKADMIEVLLLYLTAGKQARPAETAFAWNTIDQAARYIRENYADPALTNRKVAYRIGISPNYLTALFSKHLGLPVHKYVNALRIRQACRLILEGELIFTEIADRVGFASLQTFCKVFRKETGCTASEFRLHRTR